MAERIPSWIERLLLPKLSSLEGELKAFKGETQGEFKALRGEVNSLRGEFNSLRNEINSLRGEFNSLRNEINSLRGEIIAEIRRVDERINGLEKRLDIVQRMAILEAEVKELREKLAKKE